MSMPINLFTRAVGRASVRLGGLSALALLATISAGAAGSSGQGYEACVDSGSGFICSERWGGRAGGFPLIVRIPAPPGERETSEAAARERRWTEYCRPSVYYDNYGVGRYTYAAVGCEFGRDRD
jgi:hypothetical protein